MKLGACLLAATCALSSCGIVGNAQQELRTAVDLRREPLAACYRDLLAREPEAMGGMRLNLDVRHEQSRVTGVEVVWTELRDRRFVSCVTTTLRRILLPEAPTSNLSVRYTFTFDQTEPAGP